MLENMGYVIWVGIVSIQLGHMVTACGRGSEWVSLIFSWDLNLWRDLNDWEMDSEMSLLERLYSSPLNPGEPDVRICVGMRRVFFW